MIFWCEVWLNSTVYPQNKTNFFQQSHFLSLHDLFQGSLSHILAFDLFLSSEQCSSYARGPHAEWRHQAAKFCSVVLCSRIYMTSHISYDIILDQFIEAICSLHSEGIITTGVFQWFHSQIFWKYCHTFSAVCAKEYDRSAYETFYEAIELFSQLASLFNLVLNLNFSKNLIKAFLAEMITFTFDLPWILTGCSYLFIMSDSFPIYMQALFAEQMPV